MQTYSRTYLKRSRSWKVNEERCWSVGGLGIELHTSPIDVVPQSQLFVLTLLPGTGINVLFTVKVTSSKLTMLATRRRKKLEVLLIMVLFGIYEEHRLVPLVRCHGRS
jgi:hypothetical protein